MLVYAARRRRPIVHASNVVQCDGPNSPHAFDIIPLQPRNGTLDAKCPICKGQMDFAYCSYYNKKEGAFYAKQLVKIK